MTSNMADEMSLEEYRTRAASFGRRLGSNDKNERDKAIRVLERYLSKHDDFTELGMLKIWLGLFYCMWMADKVPVQEELAQRMASLIHCFKDVEGATLFLRTFFMTVHREWHGIDQHRLNKFYSLVRRVVRETFGLLHKRNWSDDSAPMLCSALREAVFDENAFGLRLHFVDVALGELHRATCGKRGAAAQVSTYQLVIALLPALQAVLVPGGHAVAERVLQAVLEPLARDYALGAALPDAVPLPGDAAEGDGEAAVPARPAFPLVDPRLVSALLFDMASDPEIPVRRRGPLYALEKEFRRYAKRRFKSAAGPPPTPGSSGELGAVLGLGESSSDESEAEESDGEGGVVPGTGSGGGMDEEEEEEESSSEEEAVAPAPQTPVSKKGGKRGGRVAAQVGGAGRKVRFSVTRDEVGVGELSKKMKTTPLRRSRDASTPTKGVLKRTPGESDEEGAGKRARKRRRPSLDDSPAPAVEEGGRKQRRKGKKAGRDAEAEAVARVAAELRQKEEKKKAGEKKKTTKKKKTKAGKQQQTDEDEDRSAEALLQDAAASAPGAGKSKSKKSKSKKNKRK